MFPLAGKSFPQTSDALARSIEDALGEVFELPKKTVVQIGDGKFPKLKTVRINLSGASVSATEPPDKPKPSGKREDGPRVDKLEITAQPIKYEQTQLNLKVTGSGLQFDFARDKKGHPLLVLTDAEDGKVEAKISKADLETLARQAAEMAAGGQGIKIQDLDLDLKSDGPRSVAVDVRIKARKMLVSGTIHITGRLDVDDELNAVISKLSAEGEGIVGTAAAALVQKKIKSYNGKEVPLMAFSLGDVALRDLKISVKKDVSVSAVFGKEA
jgi:hypothetical protein